MNTYLFNFARAFKIIFTVISCILIANAILLVDFKSNQAFSELDHASHHRELIELKQNIFTQFKSPSPSARRITLNKNDLITLQNATVTQGNGLSTAIKLDNEDQWLDIRLRQTLISAAGITVKFTLPVNPTLKVSQVHIGRLKLPESISNALISVILKHYTGLKLHELDKTLRVAKINEEAVTFEIGQ